MSRSKMRKVTELPKHQRAVIAKYIRVSTDKQREEGFSIDIQRERLDHYVRSLFPETEYMAEYREYVDDGYSGGSLERPRMTRLIEDVTNGEITHVVVMKLDRLSRSQKDTLYLIEDVFLPNNVAFISMGESFNTATAFGRAVVGILSVFAQLERENIYERTRSGMQKRVELGYWPGGGNIPFGYDYDRETGTLVPNEGAEVVRHIFELYLMGYSKQAIADICGMKYERSIDNILNRKTYTGVIPYNGKEYPGLHPPIISAETYRRAAEMMAERAVRKLVPSTDHLLTGLVVCGKCGARMRYMKWGKAGFRLVCYSRYGDKPHMVRDPDCGNAMPWAEDVEAAVEDAVFHRAKQRTEESGAEREKASPLQLLREQRSASARKLKRLYGLYAAGDDVLLDAIEEVKKELDSVDRQIEAEQTRAAVTRTAMLVRAKLESVEDYWNNMRVGEKREILNSVLSAVVITDAEIRIDFKY